MDPNQNLTLFLFPTNTLKFIPWKFALVFLWLKIWIIIDGCVLTLNNKYGLFSFVASTICLLWHLEVDVGRKASVSISSSPLIVSCCYPSICSWSTVRMSGTREEKLFPEPALLQDGEMFKSNCLLIRLV